MTTTTNGAAAGEAPTLSTSHEIGGMGHSLRRKEDDRFIPVSYTHLTLPTILRV